MESNKVNIPTIIEIEYEKYQEEEGKYEEDIVTRIYEEDNQDLLPLKDIVKEEMWSESSNAEDFWLMMLKSPSC